jgi:hypothetical protein
VQVHPQLVHGIVSGNSLNKYGKQVCNGQPASRLSVPANATWRVALQNVCKEDILAMPELTTQEIRDMYAAAQAGKSICKVLPRKNGACGGPWLWRG